MLSPNKIEELYQEFTSNLKDWAHDGVVSVDLKLLHELNLLETLATDQEESEDFSQYFHVIETPEKVTLFNEQFVIWIVPKMEEENPVTYVYIALSHEDKTTLEIVFTTSGVYNTPKFVLKVLQYYLLDMIETEATLTNFKKED